jgi:hypothetical protein
MSPVQDVSVFVVRSQFSGRQGHGGKPHLRIPGSFLQHYGCGLDLAAMDRCFDGRLVLAESALDVPGNPVALIRLEFSYYVKIEIGLALGEVLQHRFVQRRFAGEE